MLRRAFTMIELIFAIAIMGILGKFGVEFLARAYETYFSSTLNNRLQQQSEAAVTQLAARLQYRIKSSVQVSSSDNNLSWVGMDIEGWRGSWDGTRNVPNWSGFINIETSVTPNVSLLRSPESNNTAISSTITALSGDKTIADAAIFFTGASNPTSTVWDGAVVEQSGELAHPINSSGTSDFQPSADDFSGVDVYEFYKLAWSAYTIRLEGNNTIDHSVPYISSLDQGVANGSENVAIFDGNDSNHLLLSYPISTSHKEYGWIKKGNNQYAVLVGGIEILFTYDPTDGSFTCDENAAGGDICKQIN